MKKAIFCLLFSLVFESVIYSQNSFTNNLAQYKKYSYLIIQYPKIQSNVDRLSVHVATGFFMRYEKRLFLVTNYHVVSGVEGWNAKFKNAFKEIFDSIRIRYYDTQNNPHYYTINLGTVNKERKLVSFLTFPDVFVQEIKHLPKDARINSIEKFISSSDEKSDQRIAFSYQYSLSPGNDIARQINDLEKNFSAYTFGPLTANPQIGTAFRSDMPITSLTSFNSDSIYSFGSLTANPQIGTAIRVGETITNLSPFNIDSIYSFGSLTANPQIGTIFRGGKTITNLSPFNIDSIFSFASLTANPQIGTAFRSDMPITSLRSFNSDSTYSFGSLTANPQIGTIFRDGETITNLSPFNIDSTYIFGSLNQLPRINGLIADTNSPGNFETFQIDSLYTFQILTLKVENYPISHNNISTFNSYINADVAQNKKPLDANFYLPDNINFETFLPTFYQGEVVSTSDNNIFPPNIDSLNVVLLPSSYQGSSGSPVFYKCIRITNNHTKEWIEFAGVQSGISQELNISIIVKGEEVLNKIKEEIKKRN